MYARVSQLSLRATDVAREREQCCALVCLHAVLAFAAQSLGWSLAARSQMDAAFVASPAVLFQPSQHMVSALSLLGLLSYAAGDREQAHTLTSTAWLLARPDTMNLQVCAWARAYAVLHDRAPAHGAAFPPPPLLLGDDGVSVADAVRAYGDAYGFMIRQLIEFFPAVAVADEARFLALSASTHMAWGRIAATGEASTIGALERLPPPTFFRDFILAHFALRAGDEARAIAAAKRLAPGIAAFGRLLVHSLLPLLTCVRLQPVLRRHGEAATCAPFDDVLTASACLLPALLHEDDRALAPARPASEEPAVCRPL